MSLPDDRLTADFIRRSEGFSAAVPLSLFQKIYYPAVGSLFLLLLLYRWDLFLFAVGALMTLLYLPAAFLRFGAAFATMFLRVEKRVSPEEINSLDERELPVYTILIPLYHEAAVARRILARIAELDYPADKLDVKLLLEADDGETRSALAGTALPAWCEVVDIPGEGRLRTKPRACNYGLLAARGEYLVIYDAEDAPEPDQLKKAVCVFSRPGSEDLICIQAKLNFYNADQNLLTKLFTVEYSTHFDMLLPGLQIFRLPLPLGGTSNHFRTKELRKLNGWDPFNVTEDCDLGIRIFENGCRTVVLESTTWEEANPKPGNWLRQRSRWVKGYLQTHLVHYRNPFRTLKRLGIRGFFGCYSFVGGTVLMMLANLVYWPLILLYAVLFGIALAGGQTADSVIAGPHAGAMPGIGSGSWHLAAWPLYYAGPGEDPLLSLLSRIFFFGGILLFLTNFLLIAVHAASCIRRRFFRLIPYSILMPFYWILISAGAWMGVLQFIRRPFYWEKTRHGLDEKPFESKTSAAGGT